MQVQRISPAYQTPQNRSKNQSFGFRFVDEEPIVKFVAVKDGPPKKVVSGLTAFLEKHTQFKERYDYLREFFERIKPEDIDRELEEASERPIWPIIKDGIKNDGPTEVVASMVEGTQDELALALSVRPKGGTERRIPGILKLGVGNPSKENYIDAVNQSGDAGRQTYAGLPPFLHASNYLPSPQERALPA